MLTRLRTYLEISDRERAREGRALAEAEAVVAAGDVREGARVLDAGAGQGWHALALAGRFRVDGIEPTTELLMEGRRRAGQWPEQVRPRLVRASAAGLPFPDAAFQLAFSIHTSLGYGTLEEDAAALEELRRVLEPGARLVLQAVSAASAALAHERAERFEDGAVVLHQPAFDEESSRFHEHQELRLPDGRAGSFGFGVRVYDPSTFEELTREAGFHDVRVFGGFECEPWSEGDPAVLVARAPL